MQQTPREIVTRCLKFEYPERIPRDLWVLPWSLDRYPEVIAEINRVYPSDFITVDDIYNLSTRMKGDRYRVGFYTDAWGCVFKNIQNGIIGEVKEPIIRDISEWKSVNPPYEQLPTNTDESYDYIKRFHDNTDKFTLANCCPRPWERFQFLRGTENALIDIMMPEQGGRELLKVIHDFYMKELEFWVRSPVDAVRFMDDWGSQKQLLIHPEIWRELFKPLYREYCDLIKSEGKWVFFHTDGYIMDIFEDLIEIGVDAINSQIFCMDIAEIGRRFKGRITFWGEIDRQKVLPSADPEIGREAVRKVAEHLYDPSGGVIAQFEFGPGANPVTTKVIFDEWHKWEGY